MGILDGQVAIVTGGARGLGRGIAETLAGEGAAIVIADLLGEAARKTAQELEAKGARAAAYEVNVTRFDQVEGLVSEVVKRFGRLDIMVNNAGNTTHPAWCWEMSNADWQSVIDTHINGTFYGIKAAARVMKERRYGRIVNLSSVAAVHGFVTQMNYAAAKFAIVGMTLSAAKELGPHGITVNAMQPGVIRSDMTAILLTQGEERVISATPTRRVGEPSDVGNVVRFFVSPASEFITGVVVRVDGGMALKLSADDDITPYADLYPGKEA
ncbi:MAG: SDR family oxidoreductase [Deltaproteobacteria bacterium]|nr:SDR family oxidoreductase [Deltaproteobacteria bacterium]